jgi:hypothetical protein
MDSLSGDLLRLARRNGVHWQGEAMSSLSGYVVPMVVRPAAAFAAALSIALALSAAPARSDEIFAPGDPIVTGFAGVLSPDEDALPPGSDPLDYTFIDPEGHSLLVKALNPEGPPSAEVMDSPETFAATAEDIGQVFGVALDNANEVSDAGAPNIYVSATSAYGLNIVVPDADGNPIRSRTGAPDATFMPGQWGSADGAEGYPGSIWKIDGETGEITLFTTIAANSGASLGGLVFDPSTQQFFVSDLDTGLIYRLADDGTIVDTYDHGVAGRTEAGLDPVEDDGSEMDVTDPSFNSEDPSTWGFTQPERKVNGLAMQNGRLYYTVESSDDAVPQIWSVKIKSDGSFGTPRWELDVAALPSANEVTGIVFDTRGRMILAQRGQQIGSYDYSAFAESGTSSVVRYEREFPDDPATPGIWTETPDSYAIGFGGDGANAAGGVALGYAFDNDSESFGGACGAYLWATGDSLRDDPDLDSPAIVSGLQGVARTRVLPQNDPPELSFFIDYDGNTEDDQADLTGHVGSVAIWQVCEDIPDDEPPFIPPLDYDPPEDFNLTLEKWSSPYTCFDGGVDWWCSFTISVENTGSVAYWGPVTVDDYLPAGNPGATMHFWPQPPWNCSPTGPTAYQCTRGAVLLFPGDSVVLHEVVQLPKAMVAYCDVANVAGLQWPFWGGDDDSTDDFNVGVAGIPGPGCVPPGGGSDLKLKKVTFPGTCFDAGLDWLCTYLVTVQNAGPGNYTGPITVKDTLGVDAPATTLGPWACGQVGPVLTCDILAPPVNAPPGWTSGFLVTALVKKNVGPPLCDLDNKANIFAPAGGTPTNVLAGNDFDTATTHIPDPACLIPQPDTDLEMQKTGLGCFPAVYMAVNGYACEWQMTLTNVGPDPYNGPLTFRDTSAGATLDTFQIIAPAVCTGPSQLVTCTIPGPIALAPGVPHSVNFYTFYPDGPAVCTASNNLSILAPNPGSAQNPGGNDSASDSQALPNPACALPGAPQLVIEKTALGCADDPSSTDWLCDFEIKVTNLGSGPQPAPVQVTDYNDKPTDFSGAACAPSGPNQWLCTKPTPINAGANWTFNATTHVDPTGVTLADCEVVNTARIMPLSADPGTIAQSTQKVPQLFINVGPGPVAVYCDPPSLKLKKTAGKTVKSGDGYNSTFVIRATSTGPDPYHGTVELDEALPPGASYVSSNWTCVPTTGNDVHCSSPFKNIPVGKYTELTIVIHIPADVAKKAECNVVNTVNAAISAEVLHSDEGVQYTASAKASLPASACREAPQCRIDQVKPDGTCCPADETWNGKRCVPPKPDCADDSHVNADNQCVCDQGTHGKPGQCVPDELQCPRDSHAINGKCVCDIGTHGTPGKCKPDEVELQCPRDSHESNGQCVCDRGTHGTPGQCVPNELECPRDSHASDGKCVCNEGTHGAPGKCRPDVIELQCPRDSHESNGECVCDRGTHGTPGQCEADKPVNQCPDDSHFDRRLRACVCNPPLVGDPGSCQAVLQLQLNGPVTIN